MNSVTVPRLLLTEELHVRLRQQQQHGEHKNNVPATNTSFSCRASQLRLNTQPDYSRKTASLSHTHTLSWCAQLHIPSSPFRPRDVTYLLSMML